MFLGHYLKDKIHLSGKATIALSLVCLVIGYAVTYYGFRYMTAQQGITERQLELFFLYCSPNVLLMTIAWYLLIQKIEIKSGVIISALANITKCGLGIYMIHYFIVGIGYLVIDRIGVPVSMRIPATALFVFAVSWAVVSLLYKACPKVTKWVMG